MNQGAFYFWWGCLKIVVTILAVSIKVYFYGHIHLSQNFKMKKTIVLVAVILFRLCSLDAQALKDTGSLKILAIGNSFSEDALENYLYDLAKAAHKKIIIGNMYIGGAPIDLHVSNADSNKHAYDYRKILLNGEKETRKNVSIEEAIADEHWDYISLQQASPLSGKYDVIMKDLPRLIQYVKSKAPGVALIYHQTWAYQQDSKHTGFANYNRSQQTMYRDIVAVSKKLNKSGWFAFIVPSGTAVQNGRTSSIGDHYTRDGYHLNFDYGRFTAACTWYEKLFNKDVRKNTYQPSKLSDKEAAIARMAAHKAVKRPFRVSQVKL